MGFELVVVIALMRILLFTVPDKRNICWRYWRWKEGKIFFIATLIVFYFLMQCYDSPTLMRIWRRSEQGATETERCTDVLKQMRYGKWQKRQDLKPSDVLRRKEEDIRIRMLRGLPIVLHRDDLRCGSKFPLNSTHSGFNFDLPSLCDPTSSAPCCSDAGWCASGKGQCSCNGCIDFSQIVSAELHEYVPSAKCRFENFTSKEACDLLSRRLSSLTIIGDSLVRHLHNAMTILFTDDRDAGCLAKGLPKSDITLCSGDMQFVDGGKCICHNKTAQKISQLPEGKFCGGKYDFEYSFHEFYSSYHAMFTLNKIRENLNRKNSVVAIGVGLHMALSVNTVINDYVQPIITLKEQFKSQWPLLVWLTTHAPGSLKPLPFLDAQNAEKVFRFNKDMTEFLELHGVAVFDTFNLTLGVNSYDGTHYGFGVNMVKAQLLLNFLEENLVV